MHIRSVVMSNNSLNGDDQNPPSHNVSSSTYFSTITRLTPQIGIRYFINDLFWFYMKNVSYDLDPHTVKFLHKYGVDFNSTNHGRFNSLTAYISLSPTLNVKVIQLLVKYGANVNHSWTSGTPLKLAIRRRASLAVIRSLVEAGAAVDYNNARNGENVLSDYLSGQNEECLDTVKYLLAHSNIPSNDLNQNIMNYFNPYLSQKPSLEMISFLLKVGVNPNPSDDNALFYVNRDTPVEVIERLVLGGANINHVGYLQKTPILHFADRHCSIEVLEKSVALGADMYCVDRDDQNILMTYLQSDLCPDVDTLTYLLSFPRLLSHLYETHINPLQMYFFGCRKNNSTVQFPIVQLLLKAGSPIDIHTLNFALLSPTSLEIFRFLLNMVEETTEKPFDMSQIKGFFFHFFEGVNNSIELMKFLFDHFKQFDINDTSDNFIRYNLLMEYLTRPNSHNNSELNTIEILTFLFESGINPNYLNMNEDNALRIYLENTSMINPAIVQLLVKNGVDVKNVIHNSSILLSLIRQRCPLEVYQILGPHIDEKLVYEGKNILMMYLEMSLTRDEDIIKYLISIVSIDHTCEKGRYALYYYLRYGPVCEVEDTSYEVIKAFIDAGCGIDIGTLSYIMRLKTSKQIIEVIVDAGVDISYTNSITGYLKYPQTKDNILFAYFQGKSQIDCETVAYLLFKTKININLTFFEGINILMYYLERREFIDPDIVSFLLSQGIDVNHIDHNGNNALSYYLSNSDYIMPEVIRVLVEGGVNVNYQSANYKCSYYKKQRVLLLTPILLTTKRCCNIEIYRELVKLGANILSDVEPITGTNLLINYIQARKNSWYLIDDHIFKDLLDLIVECVINTQ